MTLRIIDLCIARAGLPVLEGLSFDVAPGQALILRGANGIGKTTLLRTIAGLQPPVSGQILGAGEQVAYAGHADGIKPTLNVAENLAFWADIFGQRDIGPALAAFELKALSDRRAGALSAGQKRRLGLARLLVTGRAIWILDEPTVSLDTGAVEMFVAAIVSHLGQGGSALIATHIDIGVPAKALDLTSFKARFRSLDDFDEAFA